MKRLAALIAAIALAAPLAAGPSSSGGSRPSSGFSGGNSRPSGSGASSSRPSSGFSGGSSKPTPAAPVKGSGFSGGSEKPKPTGKPAPAPTQVSKKPAAGEFNKLAAEDSKRVESRRNYEKAQEPAKTYRTPKGDERPVKARDPEVEYLRGRLDGERWASRPARYDDFYRPYMGRPLVMYSDPYSPMWHLWLMDRGTDFAALWLYHHAATVDAARRDAMFAQDANLRVRVAALEADGRVRRPTWVPLEGNDDLMYNDGFVAASYNPTPKVVDEESPSVSGKALRWVFIYIPLLLLVGATVAWLVFFKRL